MTDILKGPKDDGDFFGRNGTLQSFLDTVGSLKSSSATGRLAGFGGLGKFIAYILSLI